MISPSCPHEGAIHTLVFQVDGHGAATPCGDESELQGLSGAPVPLTESKKAATDVMENGDKHLQSATLDEKLTHRDSENSSGSSLSAESEPFVPSAPSSQQATPRQAHSLRPPEAPLEAMFCQ